MTEEQLTGSASEKEDFDYIRMFERLVRPLLTVLITGVYNVAMVWGLISGSMTGSEYAQSVGPANMLILGFWFGERSALKSINTPPPGTPPASATPPKPATQSANPATPPAPAAPSTTSLF
jgi:hypothetical protein